VLDAATHTALAAIVSGAMIGLILAALGSGGSVLAVPLLVWLVGIDQPHVAIGTGAIAVAANALFGLSTHARRGTVRWPCGLVFAGAGVAGAAGGAILGKLTDPDMLLGLFGLVMIVIGVLTFKGKADTGPVEAIRMNRTNAGWLAPRLAAFGAASGLASGFFGIGGGFLIVPALVAAAGLPIEIAMGTSLVAVSAFGLTAAATYAGSGLVDWPVAGWMMVGGLFGAGAGAVVASKLAPRRALLSAVFGAIVVAMGLALTVRGLLAFIAR
jgi:uncharacterized protein